MAVQKKTYTSAEFSDFAALPENANRLLELIDGEIVEKMPSFTPSKIAVRFARYLGAYADDHDLGYVTGADGSYVISKRSTFIPDVGYISKERLPEEPRREAPAPPDLAVEVKSPTDSPHELRAKVKKYLAAGTRLVWLVFPDDQLVEVYVPNKEMQTVGMDGELDGGDVLPGFKLALRDVFR